MKNRIVSVLIVSLAIVAPTAALAQWPSDPLVNLAIAAKTDEQVQPKVRTVPDGSAYISWFDNDPSGSPAYGYDVFLQYVDPSGLARWDPAGIRIADRGLSSTTEYGLDVDAGGNALLAFNDDRSGVDQITATKVSPAGVQLWGPTGVQLTADAKAKFAPEIVATSDGNVVVAWAGTTRKGAAVLLTKLDANGTRVWDVTIDSARGYVYDFSHLVASDGGSVIVSWVRTTFKGPIVRDRHLMAQKYSAKGRPEWGKGVVVFDGGTLQLGEFPSHLSDGSGGAVFAWYTTDPLESYAQRLTAEGVEMFPHNGVAAATSLRTRAEPSVAYDTTSGDTILVYHEYDFSGDGVYGQRISATGTRLWTDNGQEIRPLGPVAILWPTVANTPSGALVSWIEQVAYPDSAIYGAKIDSTSTAVCPSFGLSLAPGSKNRISAVSTSAGGAILAWEDGRTDTNDVYGQRVGADCSLGLAP